MKHRTAALLLLFSLGLGSSAAAQVEFGIRIGPPPAPHVVRVAPSRPGPEFIWVEGYWYPVGNHYKWHNGYWTRPAYQGARWIGPSYRRGQYFSGYWNGGRGRVVHDHRWDRDRDRDHHRDRT